MIEISNEAIAQDLISIFLCQKDRDIEDFLKKRAIYFEKLGKSRTFFLYDEDEEDFNILAYFTLAIQVLRVPQKGISNRKIKNLDGFSSKQKGSIISEFPSILIGQLGKNEMYPDKISGKEILEYCLAVLIEGQIRLGGRVILLECKPIPYLIRLYGEYGFSVLETDINSGELIQMVRVLGEEDLIDQM